MIPLFDTAGNLDVCCFPIEPVSNFFGLIVRTSQIWHTTTSLLKNMMLRMIHLLFLFIIRLVERSLKMARFFMALLHIHTHTLADLVPCLFSSLSLASCSVSLPLTSFRVPHSPCTLGSRQSVPLGPLAAPSPTPLVFVLNPTSSPS